MTDQQAPIKIYTVGALLLQALILISFAFLTYRESSTAAWDLTGGMSLFASAYQGALSLIAIWLTGEHYSQGVRIRTLQIWAFICILLSLYPFVILLGIFLLYPSIPALTSLLPVIVFLVPTVLVLVFSRLESP